MPCNACQGAALTVHAPHCAPVEHCLCSCLQGIGCKVLAYDVYQNPKVLDMGVEYKTMEEMLPLCDIVTLHCPLLPSTYHIINQAT